MAKQKTINKHSQQERTIRKLESATMPLLERYIKQIKDPVHKRKMTTLLKEFNYVRSGKYLADLTAEYSTMSPAQLDAELKRIISKHRQRL